MKNEYLKLLDEVPDRFKKEHIIKHYNLFE